MNTLAATRDREAGFTLAELMVAMSLLGIFMAIVTGSMVAMYHSSQHSEAVGRTSQEINDAYLWLERTVRYADYLSQPASSPPGIVFRAVVATDTDPTPVARCFQVALQSDGDTDVLRFRTWPSGNAAAVTTWQTLASGLVPTASGAVPFTVKQPGDAAGDGLPALPAAQLKVALAAEDGGIRGTTSESEMTFVALNAVTRDAVGARCVVP